MLDNLSDATLEIAGGDNPPASHVEARACLTGIAILGSHPATVGAAPFDDKGWQIWACSPHNVERRTLPRVDQWYECHDPIEDPTRAFGYLKAVSEMPFVWMRDKRALASGLFRGAREYPEAQLKGTSTQQKVKLSNPDGSFEIRQVEIPNGDGLFNPFAFTSSIAYMLAKAIVDCEQMGIRRIGLWGILQRSPGEYAYQRPGLQYFIWEATRRGIKVVANRESCLFDMPNEKW